MKTYIIYDTTCPEEPRMSIPGHVHHVAPIISIYDPVTFADGRLVPPVLPNAPTAHLTY